ncbi:hypothetical protein ACS0TY_023950 [Phlomoides rotata]
MTTSIKTKGEDWTELEQTYNVVIFDKKIVTTVTSHADYVLAWIRKVESHNQANRLRLIVGLDIKLGSPEPPAFLRPVALLLLCVYRSCLIFELAYATEIPLSISRFLSSQNNTFVGVGIESKLVRLQREYGLGGRAWHVDLGDLATARYNRPELSNAGLSGLRRFLHGSDVERPAVDDKWDEDELSDEHVHHACIDAYTCYEIGSYLVYPIRRGTAD